eukprot:m.48969 g.48969  ORF g.48969 m.48969 type:complete len:55 (+) comp7060_c0_seq2:1428-1592(+)
MHVLLLVYLCVCVSVCASVLPVCIFLCHNVYMVHVRTIVLLTFACHDVHSCLLP